MMRIKEIKDVNKQKIAELELKQNNQNKNAYVDLEKELLIQKKIELILEEDEAIFFKIPMESSLKILSKLVDEKDIKRTYLNLISTNEFKELKNNYKI
ncbi:MAG: hypothetical protein J6K42_04630 [Clostridia bacterium]|nr:hypothetical protein [Clostridia bacterium]